MTYYVIISIECDTSFLCLIYNTDYQNKLFKALFMEDFVKNK